MGQDLKQFPTKRRFARVHGPFYGYYETPQTPVLVYDLNLGGAFVNFGGHEPTAVLFVLGIALPNEGVISVHAEILYRHEWGVAVRFLDLDLDTHGRLTRTISALLQQPPGN